MWQNNYECCLEVFHKMYTSSLIAILLTAVLIPRSDAGHDHAVDAISDIGYTNIVYVDDQPSCSGTLISRMWTITTCLCVQNIPAVRLYVRVGDPSMKTKIKHTFYKIDNVDVHPDCISKDNEYHVEHNLALLQLKEPVLDSLIVNIIKVPNQLMYWTPDSVLGLDLAAWADMDDQATTLHKAVWHANTSVQSNKNCEKYFGRKDFKPEQTTCAQYNHKGGKDDCKLDLGAPLSYDYILIGILVHKDKCGEKNNMGSFVNIPMHSEWIRTTTYARLSWVLI